MNVNSKRFRHETSQSSISKSDFVAKVDVDLILWIQLLEKLILEAGVTFRLDSQLSAKVIRRTFIRQWH